MHNFPFIVWEKSENKKHKKRIEELYEMKNITYISTPRPRVKRGGGAAIAVYSKGLQCQNLAFIFKNH